MFSINDKVSIRQLQILLILDIFGTGVIILPRKASEYAVQDGWITIIVATVLALVCVYLMSTLCVMFKDKTFFEYTSLIAGKPMAYLLSAGFVTRILLNMAFELRLFGEIVKQTMLNNTPFWIICIFMLMVSGYAAAKGYETRARIAEMLIYVIFVPLIIVFFIGSFDIDFTNILPVFAAPPGNIFKGGFFCLSAFTGIEMLLLTFPYITTPEKIKKGASHSIMIIGIFMTAITFITICRFGPDNIQRQMWPVLEMMDTIDIPGSFIERQEALIMSFWIISMFAIVNAGLFFSSILMKTAVKKGKHSHYILISIGITFLIAMLPDNMAQVYDIMDFMFLIFGVGYMAAVPFVLLVIAKIRGFAGDGNET